MATNNFIAEISIFPYTFAPRDYTWCMGQYLAISQFPTVYSLVGTLYGGNGSTIFAIPNLKGRTPIGWGTGPGLSPLPHPGYGGGTATVTLDYDQIPVHSHDLTVLGEPGPTDNINDPNVTYSLAEDSTGAFVMMFDRTPGAVPDSPFATQAISSAGNGAAHDNRQPYLGLRFCMAIDGIYPSRN